MALFRYVFDRGELVAELEKNPRLTKRGGDFLNLQTYLRNLFTKSTPNLAAL